MAKSDRDVAVLLAVVLIGTALVTYLLGGFALRSFAEGDRKFIEEPPLSKYEDHLLALDRAAVDKAYSTHIGLVFSVWMKDPNDPDAPRRAGTGARNARAGYEKSIEAVERRERRLKESKPQ